MKLRQMIKFLLFSLLVMFFLSGCNSNSNNTDVDLFQYKGSYVGDNSAIVNSVIHLQGAKHFSGLELKTKEEPYGIIVNYDWIESELNDKETAINNASYLFSLIQNVDWVTFNFEMVDGMEEYKITRENLQEWYGINLSEIENEDKLKELIQESLEDDKKVNQILN
ncbi:DUF4825 domain-containing protein [Alkalibacillus haloalkaliphilus]|uniref:DUF4825 domain-containing protein n=1 Tax=Alkalibacillus haloalkaliphilus TaxID=94136 RepID=UPI001ED90B3F|nr:DUF4825 domain-containing protein [Alkalibacillus haloalkaliphilus]